jgi:lipopolysaccharide/colanic/teichoic acid biosynthesis glycosyltransferase
LKIGKFLKRYQLDELPQLINVFKGEMSLVGPRPEVKLYVDMMSEEERSTIFSVLPGMTDFASLWNFHEGDVLKGSVDPEKTYMEKIRPEKIRLQMEYVKKRSFLVDLKIIIKTVLKVFINE